MAFRQLHSMMHDDETLYDLGKGMPDGYEPPEYPSGLCFSLPRDVLAEVGADGGEPNDEMSFSAMGEVTSVFKGRMDCRIELELMMFAGENGQFVPLNEPCPCICFCQAQLDALGLDSDCERGDTLHLIGTVRMESTSSTELSGDMVSLQITDLDFLEDESTESRRG